MATYRLLKQTANPRSNGKSKSKGVTLQAFKESFKKIASGSDTDYNEIDPPTCYIVHEVIQAFYEREDN